MQNTGGVVLLNFIHHLLYMFTYISLISNGYTREPFSADLLVKSKSSGVIPQVSEPMIRFTSQVKLDLLLAAYSNSEMLFMNIKTAYN